VVGKHPVLDPRAGVDEQIESFANGELSERVLALDELFTAHPERLVTPGVQVVDEWPPVVDVSTLV
jgi:hypothetical protein